MFGRATRRADHVIGTRENGRIRLRFTHVQSKIHHHGSALRLLRSRLARVERRNHRRRFSVRLSARALITFCILFLFFLDAPSHLYKRSCLSVRPSVRPVFFFGGVSVYPALSPISFFFRCDYAFIYKRGRVCPSILRCFQTY